MELLDHYEKQSSLAAITRLGLTEADVKAKFESPDFSIKNLRLGIFREYGEGNLREGTAETTFGQLLRVGVQALANDYFAWAGTETIYQDIVDERPSNKYAEFYAPMFGGQLPKPVERSGRYASSYFKGTDSMLVNEKWGRLYEFEKELWEDDKTGQIKQKAQDIGMGMRVVQEICFSARLTGNQMSFPEDLFIGPPTIVNPVYSTTMFGTIGNKAPNAGTRLSQAALEEASIAMLQARDPLHNLLLTKMDTLVVSTWDMFTAAKLINSTLQPSVPGAPSQTLSNLPGQTIGFVNTINPLYGLYKLKVGRYIPQYHWYLGQAKKGLILQSRSPLEIIQENPASGESFSRDVLIFKSTARWTIDWIQGSNYFWYQGYY